MSTAANLLSAPLLAIALTACATSKTQSTSRLASESAGIARTADSLSLAYLNSIVYDKPVIEITRLTPRDTVRVTFSAEKATIAARMTLEESHATADSMSSATAMSSTYAEEHQPSVPQFRLHWLLWLLLPAAIVLSWRGIRSRR